MYGMSTNLVLSRLNMYLHPHFVDGFVAALCKAPLELCGEVLDAFRRRVHQLQLVLGVALVVRQRGGVEVDGGVRGGRKDRGCMRYLQ